MEPQLLYTYFSSKHAVYDRLFLDGNKELLVRFGQIEGGGDHKNSFAPSLACSSPSPLRTGPAIKFPPNQRFPTSNLHPTPMPLPSKCLRRGGHFSRLSDSTEERTSTSGMALVAGLASQQLANDREGDRYLLLIDEVVALCSPTTSSGIPNGRHRAICLGERPQQQGQLRQRRTM